MPKNEEEPWCLQILYLNLTRWTGDSHHVTSTKIERIQLFISTGKERILPGSWKYGKELIHYVYLDPVPKEDKFRQLQEVGILGFQELCCKIGHLSI